MICIKILGELNKGFPSERGFYKCITFTLYIILKCVYSRCINTTATTIKLKITTTTTNSMMSICRRV